MCEDKCCGPVRGIKDTYMSQMECGHVVRHRNFLSREEETKMLEKYIEELENEIKGVKRRIQEIKG